MIRRTSPDSISPTSPELLEFDIAQANVGARCLLYHPVNEFSVSSAIQDQEARFALGTSLGTLETRNQRAANLFIDCTSLAQRMVGDTKLLRPVEMTVDELGLFGSALFSMGKEGLARAHISIERDLALTRGQSEAIASLYGFAGTVGAMFRLLQPIASEKKGLAWPQWDGNYIPPERLPQLPLVG